MKFLALLGLFTMMSLICFSVAHADETTLTTQVPNSDVEAPWKPEKIKMQFDALVEGRNIVDQLDKSAVVMTLLDPKAQITFNSWLAFDFELFAFFNEGNGRSLYIDEGKTSDGVYMGEASAVFTPIDGLELKGGALEVGINPILSVMSSNTFMGATQKYTLKVKGDEFTLAAMSTESVPSSGTVTKGLIDDADNAFYMAQSLEADWKPKAGTASARFALAHFQFGNLSNNVASDSSLIGNDPRAFDGIGSGSHFIIGFGGFETAAELAADLTPHLTATLTGSYIRNIEAASDVNGTGTMVNLALTTKFDRVNLIPSVRYFSVGPDVTPATFSILPERFNDRQGFTAMLKCELKREKVNFFGSYTRGQVLEQNPYLADRDTYLIGVEGKYDIL
jgi:hypothetical protein